MRPATNEELVNHYIEKLKQIGKVNLPKNTKTIRILSIGCGDFPVELYALQKINKTKEIEYYGIDIDKESIRNCKKTPSFSKINAQFAVIDGTDVNGILEFLGRKKVHLVIFRHPMLIEWRCQSPCKIAYQFQQMVLETLPKIIETSGAIFASFYHEQEKENFHQSMSLITDTLPLSLKEDISTWYWKEYFDAGITDIPKELYAERFFLAYKNIHLKKELLEKINAFDINQLDFENNEPISLELVQWCALLFSNPDKHSSEFKSLVWQIKKYQENPDALNLCKKIVEFFVNGDEKNKIDHFKYATGLADAKILGK